MIAKRILLYVHFNKNNNVDDYVVYQLQQMKPIFDKVIIISNSQVNYSDKKRFHGLYDKFIQRENKGYDFAAWRDGIKKIGWKEIEKYDSLTLMNDTCFGPFVPMKPSYDRMEKSDVDFWGMTMHNGSNVGMPGTDGPVPKHLQSYFLVFSKNVVKSRVFRDFWTGVIDSSNVEFVIQNYETQLTPQLSKEFNYDVVVRHSDTYPDITYLKPKLLIEKGLPLVKTKAFMENIDSLTPYGLIRFIRSHTKTPTMYMYKYINKNKVGYTKSSIKKIIDRKVRNRSSQV
jgi:rhamnosyltransferase